MFGFGKKVVSDQMVGMISLEIAMFESWRLENLGKGLPDNEIEYLARAILDRENYKYTDTHIMQMKLSLITGFPEDKIKQMRAQHNFDSQVVSFCNSVNASHLLQ